MPLKWFEAEKNELLAPDGDRGGARIRMMTNGYLGQDHITYYVYRDGKYLGRDEDLAAAKKRAEERILSQDAIRHEMIDGNPAFLALSKEERSAAWRDTPLPKQKGFVTNIQSEASIDMSKYDNMELDQLVRAYNETVEIAATKGLERKPVTKFADRDVALKAIEAIESSLRAHGAGEKASKKQKGKAPVPAPVPAKKAAGGKGTEGKKPPASSVTTRKVGQREAVTSATGKLGDFHKSLSLKEGTNKEKLATLLFNKLGKELSLSEVCKSVYGKENPAIEAVIGGLSKTLSVASSPYVIKRSKEKGVGLYPAK